MVEAIHKIQSYNLFISAGMIVGFDNDDASICSRSRVEGDKRIGKLAFKRLFSRWDETRCCTHFSLWRGQDFGGGNSTRTDRSPTRRRGDSKPGLGVGWGLLPARTSSTKEAIIP
jgi:hypothetical protein